MVKDRDYDDEEEEIVDDEDDGLMPLSEEPDEMKRVSIQRPKIQQRLQRPEFNKDVQCNSTNCIHPCSQAIRTLVIKLAILERRSSWSSCKAKVALSTEPI